MKVENKFDKIAAPSRILVRAQKSGRRTSAAFCPAEASQGFEAGVYGVVSPATIGVTTGTAAPIIS
jgi:hypothetical protein